MLSFYEWEKTTQAKEIRERPDIGSSFEIWIMCGFFIIGNIICRLWIQPHLNTESMWISMLVALIGYGIGTVLYVAFWFISAAIITKRNRRFAYAVYEYVHIDGYVFDGTQNILVDCIHCFDEEHNMSFDVVAERTYSRFFHNMIKTQKLSTTNHFVWHESE